MGSPPPIRGGGIPKGENCGPASKASPGAGVSLGRYERRGGQGERSMWPGPGGEKGEESVCMSGGLRGLCKNNNMGIYAVNT